MSEVDGQILLSFTLALKSGILLQSVVSKVMYASARIWLVCNIFLRENRRYSLLSKRILHWLKRKMYRKDIYWYLYLCGQQMHLIIHSNYERSEFTQTT